MSVGDADAVVLQAPSSLLAALETHLKSLESGRKSSRYVATQKKCRYTVNKAAGRHRAIGVMACGMKRCQPLERWLSPGIPRFRELEVSPVSIKTKKYNG